MKDLKILASHPVQYHAPFFKALTDSGLDMEVGYYDAGTAGRTGYVRDFGMNIQLDTDLLEGYPCRIFLNEGGTYSKSEQFRVFIPMVVWALRERTPILLMGWVVPVDDPDALARTLRQAYEERNTWDEKGKQSMKKISRHTYGAMVDGVLSALKTDRLSRI